MSTTGGCSTAGKAEEEEIHNRFVWRSMTSGVFITVILPDCVWLTFVLHSLTVQSKEEEMKR